MMNSSASVGKTASQQFENNEFESQKRGSIFSLHSVHANSMYQYRTMTLMQSHGEPTDPIRVKSEVTLGASKRRKLLTSEDIDLKTLNQKHSIQSNESHEPQNFETDSERSREDYKKEKKEVQSGRNKILSSHSIDSKMQVQQPLLLAQISGSSNLLDYKEESQGRIDNNIEGNQNDTSFNRKSNHFLNGLSMDKSSSQLHSQKRLNNQKDFLLNQFNQSHANSNQPSPAGTSINDFEHFPLQSQLIQQQQQSSSICAINEEQGFKEQLGGENNGSDNSQIGIDNPPQLLTKVTKTQNNSNQLNIPHSISGSATTNNNNNHSNISNNNNNNNNSKGPQFKSISNFFTTNLVRRKLLNLLSINKFKRIGVTHLNLINDLSVDSSQQVSLSEQEQQLSPEEKRVQKLSKAMLEEYVASAEVWLPDNLILMIWEIIVMFVEIFLIIISPIERTFDQTGFKDNQVLYFLEKFVAPIVLGINILITMNKGYYDEGRVITSRKKIIQRYSKLMLWLDILNVICCLVYNDLSIVFIFIASVYRLAHSIRSWEQIDEYIEISHRFSTMTQVFELLCLIFLIAHLCACGFFFISKYDFQSGVKLTWISYQNIEDETWDIQYIYSIYFEFITMTTIGYGDIFPCSRNERIYVIIMTLVSCGVFGYSLNAIGQIFRDLSMQLSSFKNITKRVQFKIYKYLEYLNRQENEGHFFKKGEKILNSVSSNLKEEVLREYYGKILNQIPFFTKNFSVPFLNELSLHMKELNLAPGEFLFKLGQQDCTLFFLSKGIVELFVPTSQKNEKIGEKVLERVTGGNLIGHSEFLSSQTRPYTARGLCISHFVCIQKQDFLNVIEKFPLDQESFCTLKDDYLMKGQDRFAICDSCKGYGHSVLKCDMIFKKFSSLSIVKRYNYSENQERTTSTRLIHYKLRFQRNLVASSLKKFRQSFITKAIKSSHNKNIKTDEYDSDASDNYQSNTNNNNNPQQSELSHNLNQVSVRQSAGSYGHGDSMTFKSYSRPIMTTEGGDDDRQFYKRHQKIHYEDGQYILLTSSAHSSSELEESDDEYDDEEEYEYDQQQQQQQKLTHQEYPRQSILYNQPLDYIDERRHTYNGDQLSVRHPTLIKRGNEKRNLTAHNPVITLSPTSRAVSQTSIMMDASNAQTIFSLEQNPTQLMSRPLHTSQSYSSTSSIPFSQVSGINQFSHSTSIAPTSPSIAPAGSSTNIPPPQNSGQQLVMQPPPSSNINQLIAGLNNKNYFDTNEFLDESSSGQNQEVKKLTLFLPVVEEASETSEQSQQDRMTNSSSQLQSPLVRKTYKELTNKRQSTRKYSSNSLPRTDSMLISRDELRRKSSRADSMTVSKALANGRKVSYIMDSQMSNARDNSRGDFSSGLSQRTITLQKSQSKSHSQSLSSKLIPSFDKQRSRMSQQTLLQQSQLVFIIPFDQMKEYKYYYPHNNVSLILKTRFKSMRKKKVLKQKKTNQNSHALLKSGVSHSNKQGFALPINPFIKQDVSIAAL